MLEMVNTKTQNEGQRTWAGNFLPPRQTSASDTVAPAILSSIVVFPAFARPKMRTRNFKCGLDLTGELSMAEESAWEVIEGGK